MIAKLFKDSQGWLILKIDNIDVLTISNRGKIFVDGWFVNYDEAAGKSGEVNLEEIFDYHGVELE